MGGSSYRKRGVVPFNNRSDNFSLKNPAPSRVVLPFKKELMMGLFRFHLNKIMNTQQKEERVVVTDTLIIKSKKELGIAAGFGVKSIMALRSLSLIEASVSINDISMMRRLMSRGYAELGSITCTSGFLFKATLEGVNFLSLLDKKVDALIKLKGGGE